MKKTAQSADPTTLPTVYRYYDSDGKMLAKVAVGDIDQGVVVTAEHIVALYEFDANVQRQDWRAEKYRRKENSDEPLPEDKDPAFASWETPESVLFPDEEPESFFSKLTDRLPAVVSRLQPQQQELIQQYFYDRMTQKAIADAAGVSDAAIRNRLTKLKAQLRKMLEE